MSRDDDPILLTGAGGFLGAAAARGLTAAGYAVIATDLDGVRGTAPLDVTDPAAVVAALSRYRPAAVVHAGAVSGPMVMPDAPASVWRINVGGTVNLLEASRQTGAARVILLSSTDVYGRLGGVLSETSVVAPDTVYAASKVAAEAALAGYARAHRIAGVALRLSWVVGPGRRTRTALGDWSAAAQAGRRIARPEAPAAAAPYLHVDDAVAAVVAAVRARQDGVRVYNIAPCPVKTRIAYARAVARRYGVGIEDPQDVPDDCQRCQIRTDLAQRDLSWRPLRTPLDVASIQADEDESQI